MNRSQALEQSPVWWVKFQKSQDKLITGAAVFAIGLYLILHFALQAPAGIAQWPLVILLIVGGLPLVWGLLHKIWKGQFGSDLLAGISIVTSVLLGEYLAGAIVVLMLSGGLVLESYALSSASSVLKALSKRLPSRAHRQTATEIEEITLAAIVIGDRLVIYPHEICPVDGEVLSGRGGMDESYLTGEPFVTTKTVGSQVLSGAINGENALTIKATKLAADSRYAKIMEVMHDSEQQRPQLRRIGDQLGAIYTPIALVVAGLAWLLSGEATRFLAVLVIATPCPLLIGIPVAIIGSISLCARRAIIVRNPAALEQISQCRTAIFDKTGTLTYGQPTLEEQLMAPGFEQQDILTLVASLERYSRHPLAQAIVSAATGQSLQLLEAGAVSEAPGRGLVGTVSGRQLQVSSRNKLTEVSGLEMLPKIGAGLECLVAVDGRYAATYRFRDAPRSDSQSFIAHLGPKHQFKQVMILSGDRESEVRYLAEQVGISNILAQQSPEDKLRRVQAETALAGTLYVGDGINDAPAMMAATVGMAMGTQSDVTSEAASVVILENSLRKVDEFMHISRRMRMIALQSAIGGMLLSVVGMLFAASGYLSPVSGAICQEVIDVLAILNALRAALPPRVLHDL